MSNSDGRPSHLTTRLSDADCVVPTDLSAPRPPQQYRQLAASGAKWMNLLAVGVGADANKSTVDAYVEETTGVLEPAVSSLAKLGLLNRSYVCESRRRVVL